MHAHDQGWNNRPDVAVKGSEDVRKDMKAHAERLKKAAEINAAKSGRIPGAEKSSVRLRSSRVVVMGDRHIETDGMTVRKNPASNAISGMTYGIDGPSSPKHRSH
jgi:hypothetical protein